MKPTKMYKKNFRDGRIEGRRTYTTGIYFPRGVQGFHTHEQYERATKNGTAHVRDAYAVKKIASDIFADLLPSLKKGT